MQFSDLANVFEGEINVANESPVRHFSTDTRTLMGRDDEVFIAVKANRDGHDFIAEAIANVWNKPQGIGIVTTLTLNVLHHDFAVATDRQR